MFYGCNKPNIEVSYLMAIDVKKLMRKSHLYYLSSDTNSMISKETLIYPDLNVNRQLRPRKYVYFFYCIYILYIYVCWAHRVCRMEASLQSDLLATTI